jgi:hypothetical protein
MTARIKLGCCIVLILAGTAAVAYENSQEYLDIPFIDVEPRLEDFADMTVPVHLQGKLAQVSGFIQREPNDGTPSTFPTEVYVAYDKKHLYAIFLAFEDEPDKIRANLAPRDNVFDDDSVNIMIDTFNDQRNAYFFLSTPLGIQSEGRFIEGRGFDGSFDAVWDAEGRLTERGFIVRIKIPFSSIRFPKSNEQTWRVIFNRMIQRLSEDTFWPHYSRAIEGRLNQTAIMTGIRDISPGRNMQFAPFGFFRDFRIENDSVDGKEVDDDNEESIGLDAKMVLNDALVLDLTANPDFSQVESDEPQVTVNERFEVFFPERRPFFRENADVFETPTNLFFSRRIADPSAGVKLTGKQGRHTIGLVVADDEAPGKQAAVGDPLHGESAMNGVLRLSRDISDQSKIGILLTDRELDDGYNRVGAVDGRIKLNDNWVTQFQVAAAGTRVLEEDEAGGFEYDESDGVSYNVIVNRTGTHLETHSHYLYTSPGFQTQLGYQGRQQRPDSQDFHNSVTYRFRPAESSITDWGPTLFFQRVLDTSGDGLDWSISPEIDWHWAGGTEVEIRYEHVQEQLRPDEFDSLAAPKDYSQNRWKVGFETERFLEVGFGAEVDWGTSINYVPPDGSAPELADFLAIEADLLWRPIAPLRLDFAYLRTVLKNRGGSGRIFTNTIGRMRANWQFTKEFSLRLITDFEDTDPVPGETSLTDDEWVRVDALVKYLWNPWQALYVGYTSEARDFQAIDPATDLLEDLRDEGEQFFIKFSYLFDL